MAISEDVCIVTRTYGKDTYIYTYYTYILYTHTYINTVQTLKVNKKMLEIDMGLYSHVRACVYACHTYIHTLHTYTHYIHTYTHTFVNPLLYLFGEIVRVPTILEETYLCMCSYVCMYVFVFCM